MPETPLMSPQGDFAKSSLADFLEQTAAKTPTPGGGAVAGACGALAAALAHMVVSYSVGKKSLAAHEPALQAAATRLGTARRMLLELAQEDAAAYGKVNELMKLPETHPRRIPVPAGTGEWQAAIDASIQIPRAALAVSIDLLRLMEDLVTITNRQLRSDLAIAAVLAEATARASAWNTRINMTFLPPKPTANGATSSDRDVIENDLSRAIEEARARTSRVEAGCATP